MESFRRSTLTLPIPDALAVANGQVTYTAPRMMRAVSAQLCLSDTGSGTGATTAKVNLNGNALATLSIASAATGKSLSATISAGVNNYPGGARINAGDVITVDLTAVPGTTVPKGGFIVLDIVEVDV